MLLRFESRWIKKAVDVNFGDFGKTEYYYYDGQKMIEARNGSGQTVYQMVFGTQYIDEPVRIDINTDPASDNDCLDAEGSGFYYYHQDANYNVVALTDSTGATAQRYLYDSYGRPHTLAVNENVNNQTALLTEKDTRKTHRGYAVRF